MVSKSYLAHLAFCNSLDAKCIQAIALSITRDHHIASRWFELMRYLQFYGVSHLKFSVTSPCPAWKLTITVVVDFALYGVGEL